MLKRVKRAEDLLTRGGKFLVCSKCHVEKELTEENFYKYNNSIGFKTVCKECKKEYYQQNKEIKQEYQLQYAEKNKDYYREYMKRYNPEKGGAEGFNMKDFRIGIVPEKNAIGEKLISVDGSVKTKDGREFTRLIGGFGDDKPIFTIWQVAELIGLKVKVLMQTFNRNTDRFDKDVDYADLKVEVTHSDHEINLKDFYHYNKLNRTNQWIIFSQSGLLKVLKISNTKESWDIYENFIEDYFKTKVELIVAEKTIEENSNTLVDTKKMLLGSIFLEKDDSKRMDMMCQVERINDQLIENAKTLAKEETIEKFKDIMTIADKFTNSKSCYDIGLFANILDIPQMGRNKMYKWMREEKMLQTNNAPYQNMMDKFKVIKVDNNGFACTKTLLKGDGVKFVVNRLIKKGYINNLTTEEVLDKLRDMTEVA